MKLFAALLLVVASVHASSLPYYGWAPGQEMVYSYQSQVLNGIPEMKHWSGIKMNAKVILQTFSDYSMRIRIAEPELWSIDGQNIKLSETGRVMREQNSESVKPESVTEEIKHSLTEPFLVHMKAGLVESMFVGKNEPASITNIKKSIVSQIQLDIAGTRRTQLQSNHIQLPNSEESVNQVLSFKTKEASVQGECLTGYAVQRLPQSKIDQLEKAWRMEELKAKDIILASDIESQSEAMTVCQGKPYFLITKTKSLKQCKKSPFFGTIKGCPGYDCVSGCPGYDCVSGCPGYDCVSGCPGYDCVSTQTYVCGELNQFVVRKIAHKRNLGQTIGSSNAEATAASPTQVNMSLLKVKPITSRMTVPATTKNLNSIVYVLPVEGKELDGLTQMPQSAWTLAGKLGALVKGMAWCDSTTQPKHTSENRIIPSNEHFLDEPNLLIHYLSKDNFERLMAHENAKRNGQSTSWLYSSYDDDLTTMSYYLHTPKTRMDNATLGGFRFDHTSSADDLARAGFSPERETKIIVHGFTSNGQDFGDEFVDGYFSNPELSDKNVIVVDWGYLAQGGFMMRLYYTAAENAVKAGRRTGQIFHHLLVDQLGADPLKIHAIGHSLGSHFVGNIGKEFKARGTPIARVTGLDPARPWFWHNAAEVRLQRGDAGFVDIIHTDSGKAMEHGFFQLSFEENMGDVDFYPNGGFYQRGCKPNESYSGKLYQACQRFVKLFGQDKDCSYFLDVFDLFKACSHERSHIYYKDSLQASNNDGHYFESYWCNDYHDYESGSCQAMKGGDTCAANPTCAHMGERLDVSKLKRSSMLRDSLDASGFFLDTRAAEPFSK